MIHKLTDVLALSDDASSGFGLPAKSQTVVQHGAGVDLTKYEGAFGWAISAGTFGGSATLDAVIEDSADNSSFATLATPIAITQMTAAGFTVLQSRVRAIPRRYVRITVTPATAAVVFSAVFIGQPRSL